MNKSHLFISNFSHLLAILSVDLTSNVEIHLSTEEGLFAMLTSFFLVGRKRKMTLTYKL